MKKNPDHVAVVHIVVREDMLRNFRIVSMFIFGEEKHPVVMHIRVG